MESIKDRLIVFQKNEITEYEVYMKLAKKQKDKKNKEVLEKIAKDELAHYKVLKKYTNEEFKPNKFRVFWYTLLAFLFGLTFALNAMEKGEERAEKGYKLIANEIPELSKIMEDENKHEKMLLGLIDEEKIKYISSMVLGLNDALVELTGALAGLTFAFQNSRMVALAGLITGIAASFSMAASEYLSQKAEKKKDKSPIKASFYTGLAYIATVIFLVFPYLILFSPYIALVFTILNALLVILLFSYFVSVVQERTFKSFFFEMLIVSFGVMLISFVIGSITRKIFGIEV